MSGEYTGGLVSVFLGIYAYIPCVYLLAFSLLQRNQALYLSLVTWAALAAIVFYFNADQLSQEVWREGFEHVLLVVVFCQPLFIALIYRVPPYAAALVFAQQEASRARVALGNMSQLASVDPLTNLYNRRFLKEYWDDFGNPDRDCQVHLSMFILDIDYFKQFNDTSGHLAGDSCLQKIADEISHLSALYNGHAIRYGGEEFLILIPSSSPESTANLAELFRRAVAELKIQHPSEDFDYVTVSVGATHGTNVDSNSEATWIRAADSALYAAKRAGRNCSKLHSLAT
jgi:diguanylate cyclase (GGDEF)-like protein